MRHIVRMNLTWDDFMTGLKSLTLVRIGDLMEPCDCARSTCGPTGHKIYTTARVSAKYAAPLLSLDGIDFVKTATHAGCTSFRTFAELELIDFVGGMAGEEVETRWTVGRESNGWEPKEDDLPTMVHLGPQRQCVRRSRWRCETTKPAHIRYVI